MNYFCRYLRLTATFAKTRIKAVRRYLSEKQGLERLEKVRSDFTQKIEENYEHRAKPCSQCSTPGACCLDQHFVNVRVSRLEATAIKQRLEELSDGLRASVIGRAEEAVDRYGLEADPGKTYACPLYQSGVGCLVHNAAKPLPCIAHACYEKSEDLPPDSLLSENELVIDKINERVYGRSADWLPIPLAIISKPS